MQIFDEFEALVATIEAVHGFTEDGRIEATIDGRFLSIPDDMRNPYRGMIAEWEAAVNTIPPYVPPAPAEVPLSLSQVACARLHVDGWDVTGIERSTGLSMAFMLDEQTAWVFFSEPQPDANYIVLPADGVTKYADYIEVVRAGMVDLSLIVQRVQ